MFSINKPWDRLHTAVVGSAYSTGRFDWIEYTDIRRELEIIAQETQEDLDHLAHILTSFDVQVLRPDINLVPAQTLPPVAPRDDLLMLQDVMYVLNNDRASGYESIVAHVRSQNNSVHTHDQPDNHGANVYDMGDMIYYSVDHIEDLHKSETWFTTFCDQRPRRRYYNVGHLDGWWCAPTPGVIAASRDHERFAFQQLFFQHHFPGWQVHYLNETFQGLDQRAWHSETHPPDSEFARWVNSHIPHWLGCASETVFEINILVIDHELCITGQDHPVLRDSLKQKGCHLVVAPLRHQTFWDLGIHCATADLHRVRNSN
jgi:hypothetical protein